MMGRFVAPRAVQPIVFLLPHFWPSGGVKVYLAIATELARHGHPIVLAACEPDGALRASVPSEIEIVDLPASSAWRARVTPLRAELRSALPFLLPVILELKLHPETLLAPPITVQISQPC